MKRLAMMAALAIAISAPTIGAADGKEKAASCAAGHGAEGVSVNPLWPNLAGQHASYIEKQLAAFKSGDRVNELMSGMAMPLSEEDMRDLGAYFAGLTTEVKSIAADAIAPGESLYRGGNPASGVPACMACHGPNGAGNPGAAYPALRGQHAEYTAKSLRDYASGARAKGSAAIMQTIAAKLTDEEIEAVSAYVSALY